MRIAFVVVVGLLLSGCASGNRAYSRTDSDRMQLQIDEARHESIQKAFRACAHIYPPGEKVHTSDPCAQ